MNQLLCRVQLLAELFHLLVVAETLFVVLVQLQALSDVTAQQERTESEKLISTQG